MLTASEALSRLLPAAVLAAPPPERHEDPRAYMWRTYLEMRRRGELGDRAAEPSLRAQITALEAENKSLRAALGSGANSAAITPSEVVPPGEWRGVPPMAGPDDPKPPVVIEGKANPPQPPARKPFVNGLSDVPQHVRDTRPPNEAWRNFVKIDWQG